MLSYSWIHIWSKVLYFKKANFLLCHTVRIRNFMYHIHLCICITIFIWFHNMRFWISISLAFRPNYLCVSPARITTVLGRCSSTWPTPCLLAKWQTNQTEQDGAAIHRDKMIAGATTAWIKTIWQQWLLLSVAHSTPLHSTRHTHPPTPFAICFPPILWVGFSYLRHGCVNQF